MTMHAAFAAEIQVPKKAAAVGGLRLKEIVLPAGIVQGFDVEWPSNTGNSAKHTLDGFDGIKFAGQGKDLTHVVPSPSGWITCFLGPGAKHVEFHGMTIHGARTRAVHQGIENIPANGGTFQNCTLIFADCHIQADEPGSAPWVVTSKYTDPATGALLPGQTSTWGIFTYNADIFASRCSFDWKRGAEHALYAHGMGLRGILIDECDFQTSGGECVKLATRPGEAFWLPNQTVLVQNSTFRDWGPQPWSWRGGGGVVIQGGGANVYVQGCQFFGGPGHAKSRAVMIDDGGWMRFYSALDGTPGKGPANGWVLIQDTLIVGDGKPEWGLCARVGTLSPGAGIDVARGYGVIGCGIYSLSDTCKVEIGQVLGGNVLIERCNTPEIRSIVDAIVPVHAEAMIAGSAGSAVLSKGMRGGVFAKPQEPVPA